MTVLNWPVNWELRSLFVWLVCQRVMKQIRLLTGLYQRSPARIERGVAGENGLFEPIPVTETKKRSWNYVAVGCGQDLQWWKEFFSVLSMVGYQGDVSLEMEDLTMSIKSEFVITHDYELILESCTFLL